MNVRLAKIDELHCDPANARKHDERNLSAIGDSIKAFGQVEPLVVQKSSGKVIGGNGRLEVMRRAGQSEAYIHEVDVSDAQAAALGIALNRTAELAEWDAETLKSLMDSLPDDAKAAAGFTAEELDEMLADLTPPEVVEDEAPEPLPYPVSKTGDMWVMGGHRLLCGDCTVTDDVDRVTGGKCDVCLTDPPYGCGEAYVSHNDTQAALGTLASLFLKEAQRVSCVVGFTPGIQNVRHYPSADWMLCWFYGVGTGRTPWGFSCWQPMLVYGKDPMLANGLGCHPDGVNKLMTKDDATQAKESGHACPKPLTVWAWFLERVSTKAGQSVYEPFSGSGTTIIACEQLGRKCYAIEIAPQYVDVAVRRWQKLTGKDAVQDGTGKTWAEVAAERGVTVGT